MESTGLTAREKWVVATCADYVVNVYTASLQRKVTLWRVAALAGWGLIAGFVMSTIF